MTSLVSLLGLALLHALGAGLLALASPSPRAALGAALCSPSSALAALAVLYVLALGPAGALLGVALAVGAVLLRAPAVERPAFPWRFFAVLAALVLARPWTPTQWDEFVWLGKARLETQGFGATVAAALDPAQHLIPPGYPVLWPSAVGWLSLGVDELEGHVLAGSLLVLLAAAAALEAWAPAFRAQRPAPLALAAALAAPLAWVHLRSTYVDLPVGLLGLALAGFLVNAVERRPPPVALALAVALVGFKDEGLAHLAAATLAGLVAAGSVRRAWPVALPLLVGLVAAGSWRFLSLRHGVANTDHAIGAPYWPWVPTFLSLLWRHATDLFSWGLAWPVAAVALLRAPRGAVGRSVQVLLLANLAFVAFELLAGPERVRVFAENGTLVNRLLMQLWPIAALALLLALGQAPGQDRATQRVMPVGAAG